MTNNRNGIDESELERYLKIFQENPDSRVFAPLADFYRRLGRLDEAELVCREGISRHPYYAGGRVALAHILLDQGRLDDALAEADHVVTYYPDNLLARKLLIRILGGQGQRDRAQREMLALRALAPEVVGDPEIERALQGPMTHKGLRNNPMHFKNSGRGRASGPDPKIKRLLKKKLVLEAWIRRLS